MNVIDFPATPLAPHYVAIEHEISMSFQARADLRLIGLTRYVYSYEGRSIEILATVYRSKIWD